jgi:quinolinate synthase
LTGKLRYHYKFNHAANDSPEHLTKLTDSETDKRIHDLKARLGDRLVILGHHYQRDEVIKFADIRGDSFKLAEWAGNRKNAEYIVFCGVHFMAESADILSGPIKKSFSRI